jgi:hypothetical protein
MPTYRKLRATHPDEYDCDYWGKIRALYAGMSVMRKALKDPKLRELLFPKHLGEEKDIYEERLKRVFYLPYFGHLVDHMVATLSSDPMRMSQDEVGAGPGGGQAAAARDKVMLQGKVNGDPFYDEFFKDCSAPGGERCSFNQLMRQQVTSALLFKRAWTLCELPEMEPDEPAPRSRLEEEEMVADAAYACPVDPECVLDWEQDKDGELQWVNVSSITRRRASIEDERTMVEEVFTVYTQDEWTRHIYVYDPDKNPPKDEQPPDRSETGKHSFGRVPLVMFEVPDGLWAGGKIESVACEHFNKLNALSWGHYRSLFQFLAVKLGPPDALNPITDDANRAVNQRLGPGRVMVVGDKDAVEYVSPDAEPFKVAIEYLGIIRDEMHRVLDAMAQSVDNSGAALKRSAESKQVDQTSTTILLKELGRRTREHGEDVYEMTSRGRGEGDKQWTAQGMDQFDEVDMNNLVTEAATLETIPIPSPTFQALYKYELARRALPGATDDQLETIMDELSEGIKAEAELAKQTQDLTKDRLDQGVAPGETPPEQQAPSGPPPKGKKKERRSK